MAVIVGASPCPPTAIATLFLSASGSLSLSLSHIYIYTHTHTHSQKRSIRRCGGEHHHFERAHKARVALCSWSRVGGAIIRDGKTCARDHHFLLTSRRWEWRARNPPPPHNILRQVSHQQQAPPVFCSLHRPNEHTHTHARAAHSNSGRTNLELCASLLPPLSSFSSSTPTITAALLAVVCLQQRRHDRLPPTLQQSTHASTKHPLSLCPRQPRPPPLHRRARPLSLALYAHPRRLH